MNKIYSLAAFALLLCGMDMSAADAPLQTLPEGGKTTLCYRDGACYYAYMGNNVAAIEYSYRPIEVVEYDNGDVYLRDFFTEYDYAYYNEHSYIKGHKEGSTITFEFPQMVITQTWGTKTYYYYAAMVEYDSAKKTFVPVSQDKNVYTMTVKDDGSIVADMVNDGLLFPGMIDQDNDWVFYGEVAMAITPFTGTPVEAPADMETIDMKASMGEVTRDVTVGYVGADVYLKGIFELAPDAWIKGTFDGTKATFASGQYMGMSESGNHFGYFMASEFETEYDEEYEEDVRVLKPRKSIEFTYNASEVKFTTGDDWIMVYNTNPDHIDYMEYVVSPVIQFVSEDISLQPKDPWNVSFKCFDPKQSWNRGQISFVGSELNIDDKALNVGNLYYRIFINGEPFVFTKSDFYSISGDMTFVPYDYNDTGGQIQSFGANHFIYAYECFENITSVGVQICYIEGEAKEENIVAQSKIVSYPASAETDYTPKNPANLDFHKAVAAWDYTTFSFDIKAENAAGDALDAANLYYTIYLNDSQEPYTFVKPTYYYVENPMTYVPFSFVDFATTGMDFMVDGDRRTVYLYDKTVETAGVRLVYIEGDVDADNIVAQSEIIYPATSGIGETIVLKTIDSVTYYDLSGKVVVNPYAGVYVKVVRYTDGTSETVKVRK